MTTNFKRLVSARFCFTMATQIQAIILCWKMYEITKDALFLGLIGLSEAIPAIGLALHAGLVVDNGGPKKVYRNVALTTLVSTLILLVVTNIELEKNLLIGILFFCAFLAGVARAFAGPSIYQLVPRLVPREQIPRSSAIMTSAMQIARVSGPAVGGMLYSLLGITSCTIMVVVFLICSIASTMSLELKEETNNDKKRNTREELLMGAKYVLNNQILLHALGLDMISVLFGSVTGLLPLYADTILHVGPIGLGILRSAPAIGAFLSSFTLIKLDINRHSGHKLFISVIGFGLSILVFALSEEIYLSVFALVLSGVFDAISVVIRTTLIQLSSPDHLRGRISAINSIFVSSSNELGSFESGIAVKLFGLVPAAIFGASVCLITVFTIWPLTPKLRNLEIRSL